ncbi:hypothetical protein B0T22DRAFT_152309 [Podospora appendiculata]|uniref:Short-chain dehydrogenase n=1 Tax=Podospora appendiculata TaxID=314037 RepID=A0AAE0X970_9PEZI|nr:hypothetical protein B0T22DRAFT_152309 [Podospora appendiculata]
MSVWNSKIGTRSLEITWKKINPKIKNRTTHSHTMANSFGFHTTGDELVEHFSDRVAGRIFLITGPSEGGIGAETAISLACGNPSSLILVGRSVERIRPTIDAIRNINAAIQVKLVVADLASMASVREAAQKILDDASIPHIDVQINNAAIMACPYSLTKDGFELQLAAGHLGHFVLTNHILPKLSKPGARIINVSSMGNLASGIRWDDPNFTKGSEYNEWDAYGQTKTANVLFSIELNRRLASKGIGSFALHPGSFSSGLQKFLTEQLVQQAWDKIIGADGVKPSPKSLQQACATTLRAALDPALEGEEGVWLADCQLTTDPTTVAPWALNARGARRLWALSEDLVGEKFDV